MKIVDEIKKNHMMFLLVIFGILFWRVSDKLDVFFEFVSGFIRVISPFIYAFILAYMLSPFVTFFDRIYEGKRILSIFTVYAIIITMFLLLGNYIAPKIGNNIYDFYKNLPNIYADIKGWIVELSQNESLKPLGEIAGISPGAMSHNLTNTIISNITAFIQSTSSYIVKFAINITYELVKWIFALLVAIYILIYKESFSTFFRITVKRLFGTRKSRAFFSFFETLNDMVGRYIGIKAIDSLIIAMIALVGLSIMKSPLAFMLAFVVGITNMIPYFGPFVGMIFTAGVHLFYDPKLALISLIFLFLLQQFDGWYLDPKLVGNRVGVNPFLVILAITIGGGYFGPIGMILSVPTMALIRVYFLKFIKVQTQKSIERRKQKNKTSKMET